jgi:malate dehydrogenase (oxaloacetate-decarboxylating)
MFSIIYTPTEGDAIQNYSRLFRKPEGCFLNIRDQDSIDECLSHFGKEEEVDYIVVSDGEEVSYMTPTKQSRHAMLNLCL